MRDGYVALVFGVITSLSRLPFVANRLWEWDSVLYARALEQGFHVDDVLAGSRPHPPGYIFYVASAAIGKAAGLDSDHALVLVSVIASGIAAAAFYLLCRRFAGRTLSALLTAAFAADPLLWLHGDVAMPYVLLAPIGTTLALTFLVSRGAGTARVVAASLLFGVLTGFRQDLLLFLLPLWVWMLVPASPSARVAAVVALGAGCLLWFVPSAALSDGPAAYVLSSFRQLSGLAGVSANSERSLAINLLLVAYSLAWALLLLAFPLVVLWLARAVALARRTSRAPAGDGAAAFFALWLIPPLLFYVFVHIGEWGFVLSLVPGLYVMLAWLLAPVVPRLSQAARLGGASLIAANAVLGATLFVAGADPIFSAASLAAHDRATEAKTAYLREHVPADSAVVLAAAELLVARYYLPGYTVWYSDSGVSVRYQRHLQRPVTLIAYEPRARPAPGAEGSRIEVSPGVSIERLASASGTITLPGVDVDATPR